MAIRGLSFDEAKVELEAGYVLALFSGSHKLAQYLITTRSLSVREGRPLSFKNARRLIAELGLVKDTFFDAWELPKEITT